jgi:Right handed beta helix region
VRQGAGTIEVTIKGSNLATLVRATLGTYSLKIKSKQADGAKLEVSIPHGATLGDLNLTVENDVGSFTRNAVLEVTKITTATKPEFNPSDTAGKGTPNRPFRTVSKALTVATKGDTVLLTAGTYQTGETWPTVGSGLESATNVADGVTVEGQSSDRGAVLLLGPGNTTDTIGLALTNDAVLRNLTLQGFSRGVFRQSVYPELSGTIRLENVAIFQSAIGLNIVYAANLSIQNSLFSGNGLEGVGGSGIHLRGVGQARLSGMTQSNNNQTGMTLDRSIDVQAEGLEVKGNKLEGILVQNSQFSLSNSQVVANSGVGIMVNNSDAKSFSVAGCTIANNGSHGIDLMVSAGSISIGRSQLFGNAGWQLYDERSANNPNPIYAFSSTFEGISLESQLSLTSGTGGADVMQSGKRLLRIDQPGNTIYFTF